MILIQSGSHAPEAHANKSLLRLHNVPIDIIPFEMQRINGDSHTRLNAKEPLEAQKESLLTVVISLGNGKEDYVVVRRDDKPEELAKAFGTKHRLKAQTIAKLTKHIEKNKDEALQAEKDEKEQDTLRDGLAFPPGESSAEPASSYGGEEVHKAVALLADTGADEEDLSEHVAADVDEAGPTLKLRLPPPRKSTIAGEPWKSARVSGVASPTANVNVNTSVQERLTEERGVSLITPAELVSSPVSPSNPASQAQTSRSCRGTSRRFCSRTPTVQNAKGTASKRPREKNTTSKPARVLQCSEMCRDQQHPSRT